MRLFFSCPSLIKRWMLLFIWVAMASAGSVETISDTSGALLSDAERRVSESESRKDFTDLVNALNDEADILLRAHQFDAAEKLRLRALQVQEQRTGRNSPATAEALFNLGWFYSNMARYDEAQSAFDRCLDLRRERLGGDAPPVAEVLNALGVLEGNRSNFTLAEAFYRQAIGIQQKVPGPPGLPLATTWNNLAVLYWTIGDYESAQKFFAQALTVREKQLGPDSLAVATTLANLARLDSSLGDDAEAEDYLQRVLKIRSAKLAPDHPLTIGTVGELGMLYARKGDDDRAAPLLLKAVQANETIYRMDHPDMARSLFRLALLDDRRKLYAQAERLHLRALEMRRRILGNDHPEVAASLAALARHYHTQGEFTKALPCYRQALRIDTEAFGESNSETLSVATGLAYLQIDLGQPQEAMARATDITTAEQNLLNSIFHFAPEPQRLAFEGVFQPCDLPAALENSGLIAQVVLRTKGVVLDSLLEDEALSRAERDPEVKELLEKQRLLLARKSRMEDDLSGSGLDAADLKKLAQDEAGIAAKLTARLGGSGNIRRALATETSEVMAHLPGDAALIEYVAYRKYRGRLNGEPAYGALVLTRQTPPRWIALGEGTRIDEKMGTFQKYMHRRVRDEALANVLQDLHQTLIQPVETLLPSGIHRLILSPDGGLNFISFAALLDNKNHFLADDYALSYVSSGRDLVREKVAPRDKTLVIFANPDGKSADALPGSEKEASLLQQIGRSAGFQVSLFRGSEASKVNLFAQDSPAILHLATHGFYVSEDEVMHPGGRGANGARTPAGQAMSRSVLLLAGGMATLRDWKRGFYPPPKSDGLLTAQQTADLDLEHTWLVVLSACDSARGEELLGEGVLGLRRGFAEAGAQNVLLTLWPVDDSETANFMADFYREALRTDDVANAVADVQRARLDSLRQGSGLSEAVRKAGPFLLSY